MDEKTLKQTERMLLRCLLDVMKIYWFGPYGDEDSFDTDSMVRSLDFRNELRFKTGKGRLLPWSEIGEVCSLLREGGEALDLCDGAGLEYDLRVRWSENPEYPVGWRPGGPGFEWVFGRFPDETEGW